MRRSVEKLIAAVFLIVAAGTGHAAALQATPDTLQDVLGRARSGDTIRLAAGDYPAVRLNDKKWDPPVVVDGAAGQLTAVEIRNVSGLTWRGGTFDGKNSVRVAFGANKSDHITVQQLKISHYIRGGIIFGQSSDSRIAGNVMSDMGSDGINAALSRRIVIDGNTCRDFYPTAKSHPDCIQLWSRPSDPPTADITISNNVANGNMQGVGMFNHVRNGIDDGGFDRIIIVGNTIDSAHAQGLAATGCRDCIVADNVVRKVPGAPHYAQLRTSGSTGGTWCGNRTDSMKEKTTAKCNARQRQAVATRATDAATAE